MAEDKKPEETKEDKATLAAVEAKANKGSAETKENEADAKSEATKPQEADKKEPEADKKEEAVEEPKTPETATDKPESEAKPEPESEAKTDQADSPAPKKRFGFLFGKKQAPEAKPASPTEEPSDTKGEMAELIKEFQLASQIENKIEEKADYFVLRIRKSIVMLILGLMVVAMWSIPVSRGVKLYMSQKGLSISLPFINKSPTESTATDSASLQELGPKIRIRDSNGSSDEARNLADLLEAAGLHQVEIQADTENEYQGVGLIVKPGADELRQQIVTALEGVYEVGSPSAELTSDSDFDAVILFGKLKTLGVIEQKDQASESATQASPSGEPQDQQ